MPKPIEYPIPTHHPQPPHRCRAFGGAMPWLILVGVVIALLAALALVGPGRGKNAATDSNTPPASPADGQAITETLQELGDQLSQAVENSRDLDPLLDRLNQLLAEHPDVAEAHTLHAQMLLEAGRPEDALVAFQSSLKIQPRQASLHQVSGDLAMNLKQYEDARHHYEQARSIEPGSGRYAISLANLQLKLNEDDQALETLLTALRRDSGLHGAYALLADIYAKKNKLQLALDQSQRAIETAPAESVNIIAVYTIKRAALLRRNNQPAESLAALNALSPPAHLQSKILQDTATSWAMLGKPQMAAELYENVLRADPSSDLAAAQAAAWRIKADDPEAAKQHLQTLRQINPRHEAILELESKLNKPPASTE